MSDPTPPVPPFDPSSAPPPPPPPGPGVPPTMDYGASPAPGLFGAPYKPAVPEADPNARTWGMIAHLSALVGYLIPFGNIVGPLIVWQIRKDDMPFAADQAKEALNFHITVTIVILLCVAAMCIFIGFILLPAAAIATLVFMIIAAIQANKGEWYRYPFAMRLIK